MYKSQNVLGYLYKKVDIKSRNNDISETMFE